MNTVKLRTIQFFITGFFLLPLLMGWAYPVWFTVVVLAVLVGLFGLSHGAIDHILASDVLGWIKPAQQLRFMGQYVAVMCLYGILWFLSPVIGFWIFLLYSAWHFGQSDALPIWNIIPKGLGFSIAMSWGLIVISSIPFFHSLELAEVLPSWFVTRLPSSVIVKVASRVFFVALGFLVSCLVCAVVFYQLKSTIVLDFVTASIVSLYALAVLPMWVGFGLYFSVFHAFPSLINEYKALRTKQRVDSTKHFVKMLAPFTLLAYLGLVAIVLYAQNHSYFYALIAISILAFPHSVLMHFLYVKLRLRLDT